MRSDILIPRLGRSLLTGAVAGLGGLVPIGRAPLTVRIAWVAVPAALPLAALGMGLRVGSGASAAPGDASEGDAAETPAAPGSPREAAPSAEAGPEGIRSPLPAAGTALSLGYALGMSGLMGGLQWSSLLVDRALERFLRRRGVRRPRVVIGAASATLMAAVTWAEERADEADDPGEA